MIEQRVIVWACDNGCNGIHFGCDCGKTVTICKNGKSIFHSGHGEDWGECAYLQSIATNSPVKDSLTEQEIPDWAWVEAAKRKLAAKVLDAENSKGLDGRYVCFEANVGCVHRFATSAKALAELNRNQVTDEMMALACQAYESVSEYPYNAEALKRAIQAVVKDSNV